MLVDYSLSQFCLCLLFNHWINLPCEEDLRFYYHTFKIPTFQPVTHALMHAISEGLGSSFTDDVRNAWAAVFKVVVDTMSEFLADDDATITEDQKRLVQASWKTLSGDLELHGATMFAK